MTPGKRGIQISVITFPIFVSASLNCPQKFDLTNISHCFCRLPGSNVHPKIVSEMLEHRRVGVTPDVYGHALPGMQAAAADLMSGGPGRLGSKGQEARIAVFLAVPGGFNEFLGQALNGKRA